MITLDRTPRLPRINFVLLHFPKSLLDDLFHGCRAILKLHIETAARRCDLACHKGDFDKAAEAQQKAVDAADAGEKADKTKALEAYKAKKLPGGDPDEK